MYRYIKADQFIGAMFFSLIPQNLYEIKIVELCKLEKEINSKLREYNKAILCASIKELYSTIDDYNNFFEIESDSVKIKKKYVSKFKISKEKKSFEEKLNNYFVAGIPEDINKTFTKTLNQYISSESISEDQKNVY